MSQQRRNYRGVRELFAEIVLAQVCVRVEMDYVQLWIFLRRGADGPERDEVFAAEQGGIFPASSISSAASSIARSAGRRVAEWQLYVARVEDFQIFEIFVLIGACTCSMPKDSERIAAGAEARAGAERGRRVEGRAENYGARLVPRAFAAYESPVSSFSSASSLSAPEPS